MAKCLYDPFRLPIVVTNEAQDSHLSTDYCIAVKSHSLGTLTSAKS